MAFIGVIAESRNEMYIKRAIDNNLNSLHKEHTIIVINNKNISNIKNIRFETILIISLEEISNKDKIINLLDNSKYLVINSDIDSSSLGTINNPNLNVITFGFNQKATITASSVEEELIIFIQRMIVDINKNSLEPQEIQVENISKSLANSTHNSIGIASILLIYGKRKIIF